LVARTLITTADERTWPKDKSEPVLFLGEWCKRYSRKHIWEDLDYKVAPYHWDDRKKLFDDYQSIQKLYEELLSELTDKLNQIHNVSHSNRYWRILIGPWLGFFIGMIFDRWFMLKQVIEQVDDIKCNVIDRNLISVVPNDMGHFNKLSVDDDWNEAIYSQLLAQCWGEKTSLRSVLNRAIIKPEINDNNKKINNKYNDIKKYIKRLLKIFSRPFSKDDDYFFITSYLPLEKDLKLQIQLGQFPQQWSSEVTPISNPDSGSRKWNLLGENKLKDRNFENIVRTLIPLHIPTAYLEGYELLQSMIASIGWPKKPKAIFTSNSYLADDVFKCWTAEKIESGTSLIIGQHGGNFGMNTFAFHEEHQIEIADKWISWGWTDKKRPQIIPGCNLKHFEDKISYDPQGGALMIEMGIPRYSYHLIAAPVARQWLDYLDDQQLFLNSLPKWLQEQVTLRLYPNDYGLDQIPFWKAEMSEIKINRGSGNIKALVKKCRLCICTYNATTYLESLSWNVPTIIFWNPNHWELNEETKPYFEMLKSVGIFHENAESAAQQMIKVWDDLAVWWESEELQSVREQFCYQYASISDDSMIKLKSIIQANMNHGKCSSV
jgi:putative transferase (TIGR04331 family)